LLSSGKNAETGQQKAGLSFFVEAVIFNFQTKPAAEAL